MTEITPRTKSAAVATTDVAVDFQRFRDTMPGQLELVGLRTDVVVDLGKRQLLLSSLGGALRHLPESVRDYAHLETRRDDVGGAPTRPKVRTRRLGRYPVPLLRCSNRD